MIFINSIPIQQIGARQRYL